MKVSCVDRAEKKEKGERRIEMRSKRRNREESYNLFTLKPSQGERSSCSSCCRYNSNTSETPLPELHKLTPLPQYWKCVCIKMGCGTLVSLIIKSVAGFSLAESCEPSVCLDC